MFQQGCPGGSHNANNLDLYNIDRSIDLHGRCVLSSGFLGHFDRDTNH